MLLAVPDLVPQDFLPAYDLPQPVATRPATVPAGAVAAEPGDHWVARGLLVETAARLGAVPVSLAVLEWPQATFIDVAVATGAPADAGEPGEDPVVVRLVLSRSGGRWTLLLGGCIVGTGAHLPSPAWLADRLETAYRWGC